MNQYRNPYSSKTVAWLVTAGIGVLLVSVAAGFMALIAAGTAGLNSMACFCLIGLACGVGLLVMAWEESGALARQLAREQHALYVAQQQYTAYMAQQAEAVRRQAETERQAREKDLTRMNAIHGLLSLTPTEFEQAVAELFKFWGYTAVERTSSADSSVDIVCYDPTGQKTVVQCKQYSPGNAVSSTDVDPFIRMMTGFHHAHKGVFVTTSSYTEPALTLGDTHDIWMIDGTELADHMQEFRAAMER